MHCEHIAQMLSTLEQVYEKVTTPSSLTTQPSKAAVTAALDSTSSQHYFECDPSANKEKNTVESTLSALSQPDAQTVRIPASRSRSVSNSSFCNSGSSITHTSSNSINRSSSSTTNTSSNRCNTSTSNIKSNSSSNTTTSIGITDSNGCSSSSAAFNCYTGGRKLLSAKLGYTANDWQCLHDIKTKVEYLNNLGGNLQAMQLCRMQKQRLSRDAVKKDLEFLEVQLLKSKTNQRLTLQVKPVFLTKAFIKGKNQQAIVFIYESCYRDIVSKSV
jgi:hypothetical protein